jgi:hypothetical protein
VCRVPSDAGERLQLLNVSRKFALIFVQDHLGKLLKPQRAIVVTHPFPGFDDIRGFCFSQSFEGGKSLEKLGVFRQNSRDLSLLQHNFG